MSEIFELLGGGSAMVAGWEKVARRAATPAIIPNATHYNVVFSPVLAAAALTFLDAGRE